MPSIHRQLLLLAALMVLPSAAPGQEAKAKRLPEPSSDEQRKAETMIKDLFKEEYAKRGAEDQKALARSFLQQGIDTLNEPVTRFVLLRESGDMAVRSLDAATAMAAIAEMEKHYEVDGPDLKCRAIMNMSPKVRTPEAAREFAEVCLEVAEEAVRQDNYVIAQKVIPKAELAAKASRDEGLAVRAKNRKGEIEDLRREHPNAARAARTIETDPADPEASLILGRYLLMKGEAEKAMGLLARGSDAAFRSAAEKHQAGIEDAQKAMEAGDAWHDLAKAERNDTLKNALLCRAKDSYEKALAGLTGIFRTRVERRLGDLSDAMSLRQGKRPWINLLPLMDPKRDAINGKWEIRNGILFSDETKCARIEIPCVVPDEYDFEITFTRLQGHDCVIQTLSRSGRQFNWGVGYTENTLFSFDTVADQRVGANPTSIKRAISNNQSYTSRVEVRRDRVSAYFDGELVVQHRTNYDDLNIFHAWKLSSSERIGLATQVSPTRFDMVRLREVTGNLRPLR